MKTSLNIGITTITNTIVLGNVFNYDDNITIINDCITTTVSRAFNLVLLENSEVGNIYSYKGSNYILVIDDNGQIGIIEYNYMNKTFINFYPDFHNSKASQEFFELVITPENKEGTIFDNILQERYLNYFNTGKRIY